MTYFLLFLQTASGMRFHAGEHDIAILLDLARRQSSTWQIVGYLPKQAVTIAQSYEPTEAEAMAS